MAVSENTGGTKTATAGGTEDTLATISSAGVYQLMVELTEMALGDEVTLRIYVKGRSTSSSRVVFEMSYIHAQGNNLVSLSPPIPAPNEFKATLTQEAGTARDFVWAIYEY